MILAKDFIETAEGLVFAVVESHTEKDKILCFLRYILQNSQWQKVNTDAANKFLADDCPDYLYYSCIKQAHLHAVALDQIVKHHQPKIRLKNLLVNKPMDALENDLQTLCHYFQKQGLNPNQIGVTGSILIAAQNQHSDIDLVFYSRAVFQQARKIVQQLIQQGECVALNESDWQSSYARRDCLLSYEEYIWHEQRKFNKAVINQRKFDLSFVTDIVPVNDPKPCKKLRSIQLKVQVINDFLAFDYPAEFIIHHPQIHSIVSYTATYTGQAQTGEWVEVAGILEQSSDGIQRIVVGSSREAQGEYIKVIHE